jgi:hypothetical protein
MAKTNFSKVEGSFDDGLRKMMVGQLLRDADANQGKIPTPLVKPEDRQMLVTLNHELRYLKKAGANPYKTLGIRKKKIADWLENIEKIPEAEWKVIKGFKEKVDKLRKSHDAKVAETERAHAEQVAQQRIAFGHDIPKEEETTEEKPPQGPNDALVDTERRKSSYKRFNISDKWLPLQ